MKRILAILAISLALTSCENEADVRSDLDILKVKRTEIRNTIRTATTENKKLSVDISNKIDKLTVLGIYEEGDTPYFILKLRLKQSHMSFDVGKHLKDEMNAIEFEIPVSEEFYNTVSVGTNLVDEFRSGSMIMEGSFGSWNMKVINKTIKR